MFPKKEKKHFLVNWSKIDTVHLQHNDATLFRTVKNDVIKVQSQILILLEANISKDQTVHPFRDAFLNVPTQISRQLSGALNLQCLLMFFLLS